MSWIKCSEQLPELDTYVLVYTSWGNITDCYLYDDNEYGRKRARTRKDKYPPKIIWRERDCEYLGSVTHWMPLPDGPIEVQV